MGNARAADSALPALRDGSSGAGMGLSPNQTVPGQQGKLLGHG